MITYRTCPQCEEQKEICHYSPKKGGRGGFQRLCKKCRAINARVTRNGADIYQKESNASDGKVKKCASCGALKENEDFVSRKEVKDGLYRICRKCMNDKSKKWQAENQDKRRSSARKTNLKKKFNITLLDYDRILASQDGGCAICGATSGASHRTNLYVDHDHETGAVRGLLCGSCNSALGFLKDDVELVKNAVAYMMESR